MQGIGQDNSSTHKWVAYDLAGQPWTGSAYEAWNDSHFSSYGITATRLGTTTGYIGTAPAGVARYELWYWTGTLSTSYAVDDGDGANATRINGVATTSVATINANVGTTQPVNFTGTGASALVKGDTVDWAGAAVATPDTAGYPKVTIKNGSGTGELVLSSGLVALTAAYDDAKNAGTKFLTMIQTDGGSGWEFTTQALSLGPAGSGGNTINTSIEDTSVEIDEQ